jgi:polysaccharide biosynthesis transport protein
MSDRKHLPYAGSSRLENTEPVAAVNGTSEDGDYGIVPKRPDVSRRDALAGYSATGTSWGRHSDEEEGVDFIQLLGVLVRRRKIMAITFVLVMLGTLVMTMLSRPIYQATAQLRLNTANPSQSGLQGLPGLEQLAGGLGINPLQVMDTQVALIKNNSVREGAMRRLNVNQKRALEAYHQVTVEPQARTSLVNVSVRSHDPKAAAALATAICQEFINSSREQNREQMLTAVKYLGGQLTQVKQRLNEASTDLRLFKENNLLTNLQSDQQQMVQAAAQIQTDLRQAELERDAGLAQLSSMRATVASLPREIYANQTFAQSNEVTGLQQQLATLEAKRRDLLQEYVPGSAPLLEVEAQIADVRRRLGQLPKTTVQSLSKVPNPLRQQLLQNIETVQAQVNAATARIARLRAASGSAQQQLAKFPSREFRLSQLETEATTLLQTYQMLNEKYNTLLITVNGQGADARLEYAATAPKAPISPRLMRSLVIAAVLGLILAIVFAAIADRLDDRAHSDAETEQITRLPVLVQVPFNENPRDNTLMHQGQINAGGEKGSTLMETYRMLRTNIVFSATDKPIRTLVITSSMPGEGKSSTSINLAVATAMSGEDVILIDCDLRRPMLHRVCGLPNNVGVSNVLSGTATLDEALQETQVPGLRVLTSGPTPPNPFKMLNSKAALALLQQLAQKARFVIIDTPPALGLADAQVLAAQVDATLMVVSCRDTRRREMVRTRDLLLQTGTELLGVVLTKVPVEVGGYYSYMGYYQYKHYKDYLKSGAENSAEELAALSAAGAPSTASERDNNENHAGNGRKKKTGGN